MDKVVWKYAITWSGMLSLPKGAQILSCANQFGNRVIWALVDPAEKETEDYRFYPLNTGAYLPDSSNDWKFLGTILFNEGHYVEHIFYKKV